MHQNTIENTNFTVADEWQDTRLDVFIFQICEHLPSRSYAAKLIQNGAIHVNGKLRKPSFILKAADVVSLNLSFLNKATIHPKAESIHLDIIYEDEHILVLNKPAGLVVHPGAGISSGTLANALLAHCGSLIPSLGHPERAGIVHRLDRDTSGVMVTAKTQLALTFLSKQFAEHTHTRIYHAICYGSFADKEGNVVTGYGRDPRHRLKYKTFPLETGKRAALKYKVLNEFCANSLFSLVECTLQTGRTHQIRVQMSALKHPIVGDVLYSHVPSQIQNNLKLFELVKQNAKRQLLHAVVLEITHPKTNERMKFTAPYPNDFEKFLELIK